MISNLASARALIQADLKHAREVLELWSRQVADLEQTLVQLDTVGESRQALSTEYKGKRGNTPMLSAPNTWPAKGTGKRGRKAAIASEAVPSKKSTVKKQAAGARDDQSAPAAANTRRSGRARGERKNSGNTNPLDTPPPVAKYKDPQSDKTWSGRGRRPGWMVGAPEQYLIDGATQSDARATAAMKRSGGADSEAQTTS
jgi:H-NS histone family